MRVELRLPTPLGVQRLDLEPATLAGELVPEGWNAFLRTRTGLVQSATPISTLLRSPAFPVEIEVVPRLLGGKGGFGANLRSAGGRMSTAKSTNVDSCRDLQGRRLGTIKEAQKQSDLLESLPELKAKARAEELARLEKLERTLGVSSSEDSSVGHKRLAEVDVVAIAAKKHKFEDDKFFEESREIKDNVRSAVSAALLKKRKKKSPPTSAAPVPKAAKKAEDAAKMPPPAVKA